MSNDISVRDAAILRHMLKYCQEIDEALSHFGNDESLFMENAVFRNAVGMPIQQIGELAKHLSDAFIEDHVQIPWRQIKGMRDWFAHQYLKMDNAVVWEVATVDLPPLKAFIVALLESENTARRDTHAP